MGWELKRLADKNLGAAIGLAAHYRDLNEPAQAESICRDVLAVAPENVDALRTLGLALTDRFPTCWMTLFDEACATFRKLPSDYERTYYLGIAWERKGDPQKALEAWRRAKKLGVRFAPLAEWIESKERIYGAEGTP